MKKVLAMLLSLAMATSLAACGSSSGSQADNSSGGGAGSSGDVIKIGVFEPLTGQDGAGGALELAGIQYANKVYPEVLGKKVELVIMDNKSDKVEAANAVSRMIEKDGVVGVLGSWGSGYSMAAGDVFLNSKIPAVGCSCTNPLVTQGNPYYFRTAYLDPFQGTVMANYANKIGAKKVAVLYEMGNDYGVGLGEFFKEAFVKLTGDENSVTVVQYNKNEQNFEPLLTNIQGENPDMIFAPGNFTTAALICKQAKSLGLTCPIVGGDTWETDEFIKVGGADVEGAVMSTFFDDTNPTTEEGKKFVEGFKATLPEGENIAAVAALGYDAYCLMLDAITRAGSTDGEAIRNALAETKDFEGVTGMISMTEEGDADKDTAVLKVVKDGKFTYLDTVEIAKD